MAGWVRGWEEKSNTDLCTLLTIHTLTHVTLKKNSGFKPEWVALNTHEPFAVIDWLTKGIA